MVRSSDPGEDGNSAGRDGEGGRDFIFVGGPPRSGTTLVQNVLDCHPRICGAPEFHHLGDLMELRKKFHGSIDREWIVAYCDKEKVDREIAEFVERFFRPLMEKHDADFLSEKTPYHVEVFPELLEVFPESKFLVVTRDPRAIVSSLLRVGKRGREKGAGMPDFTLSTLAAVEHVRDHLDSGSETLRRAPERCRRVLYEDLVTDPEKETRRITEFLGVSWSPRMLSPGASRHPAEDALTNDVWYTKASFRRNFDRGPIDKWREYLSARQKVFVTLSFEGRDDLSQAGYQISLNELSWHVRTAGYLPSRVVSLASKTARRTRNLVPASWSKTVRRVVEGAFVN